MNDDLIAKLQRATVPSRDLDGEVFWAAERPKAQRVFHNASLGSPRPVGDTMPEGLGRLAVTNAAPAYTRSLDAAVTLVPDGWAWFAQWIGAEFTEGDARLWIPSQRTQGLLAENFDTRKVANPAIALCISALKARAVIQQSTLKGE